MKIAFTHPGKIGDALYALPTIRHVYETTPNLCIDFWTSDLCANLKSLFEAQSCIHKFFVSESYIIERTDMGVQPWAVPVDGDYNAVIHLGFRNIPDRPLHEYIAYEAGVKIDGDIRYDFKPDTKWEHMDYIAIAPRGETSYGELFDQIANKYNKHSVIIGGEGDYRGIGIDYTGEDFLSTLSVLKYAKAFVGLMSSQLVLANGFDIPKIIPHDGQSWDMSHVIYSDNHYYLINPTIDKIADIIGDSFDLLKDT